MNKSWLQVILCQGWHTERMCGDHDRLGDVGELDIEGVVQARGLFEGETDDTKGYISKNTFKFFDIT